MLTPLVMAISLIQTCKVISRTICIGTILRVAPQQWLRPSESAGLCAVKVPQFGPGFCVRLEKRFDSPPLSKVRKL